jgi:3-oxoacyl-[acyl-carrier protein] reductase
VVARGKQTMYSATKHGINGVTKALALELGPHNILVNSVCPGFTNTDLVKRNPPEKNAQIAKDIPQGRFAEAAEIAELVLFLISDKNTYINGQCLVIDGGFTCR